MAEEFTRAPEEFSALPEMFCDAEEFPSRAELNPCAVPDFTPPEFPPPGAGSEKKPEKSKSLLKAAAVSSAILLSVGAGAQAVYLGASAGLLARAMESAVVTEQTETETEAVPETETAP